MSVQISEHKLVELKRRFEEWAKREKQVPDVYAWYAWLAGYKDAKEESDELAWLNNRSDRPR
jgi:hypothetical protein